MREKLYKNFKYGIVSNIEKESIPDGASANSLNWRTKGDKIELRKGLAIMGTENTDEGRITGLHIGRKSDGVEVLFKTFGKKVFYYDIVTEDWIEVGTDILPVEEDISFANYESLAGSQVWLNSQNGTLIKIMTANPESYSIMYNDAKNYKGRMKIKQNRMYVIGRKKDKTGFYMSWIDAGNYTTVSVENVGTGDGAVKTFNDTLAFRAGSAKRTCFGITVTDGTETFTDNYDGTLTGDQGGTGTINYTTGAISVTFNTAPNNSQAITSDYQWEDSTNGGIADFTYSAPRIAGEGNSFRQDDGGGESLSIATYNSIEYCFHKYKTWKVNIGIDDTNATNLIYRDKVGISNWQGLAESGSGIYYIDDINIDDPKLRVLTFDTNIEQVVPVSMSNSINLSDYRFDRAVGVVWGDFVLFACRTKDATTNDRVLIYDKMWKSFDVLDYALSFMSVYNGKLVGGEDKTNNVIEIFKNFDDNDFTIENFWESGYDTLKYEGLKKTKKITIEGEIGVSQVLEIYAETDNNGYSLIGTISGDGTYVDRSVSRFVIGSEIIGGIIGGDSEGENVYHYKKRLNISLDSFNKIRFKTKAIGIGYVSVSLFGYYDIRLKRDKLTSKYR